MNIGDKVKHGWVADKCGVIVDFYDKQHSCSGDSEERIRLYDVIWTDKTPPYKPAFGYQQRYWVLIHGKRITFPFMGHQLEVI